MTFNDFPQAVKDHWILHWNAIQADFPNSVQLKNLAKSFLRGSETVPTEIPLDPDGWPHPAYLHDYYEILLGLNNG